MSSNDDLTYWLILNEAPGLNSIAVTQLLTYFHTPQNIITANPKTLMQWGINEKTIQVFHHPNRSYINKALEWTTQKNQHILTFNDPNYPSLLKQIHDPPLLLYARGHPHVLNQPQLAIVGSRNPTPTGLDIAKEFAYALCQTDLVITSGLALGIDAMSHQGALQANGLTAAVLGSGLQHIYPNKNRELAEKIIEKGVIVSEFALNMPPKREHFPRRNRIISGLCLGTLVVEATVNSGSLITARLATEQGREVFVIPGSIYNPLSRGCHQLIQNGAKLTTSVRDIIQELGPLAATLTISNNELQNHTQDTYPNVGLDETYHNLLDCFGYEPISTNQLIERSGLSAAQIAALLLTLELKGYISSTTGGYVRVKR